MSTTIGYIPGKSVPKHSSSTKETATSKPPEPTPKQKAVAEARELGISLPADLSKITEAKIREMIEDEKARAAAEKAAAEADVTGETEVDPEGETEGETGNGEAGEE